MSDIKLVFTVQRTETGVLLCLAKAHDPGDVIATVASGRQYGSVQDYYIWTPVERSWWFALGFTGAEYTATVPTGTISVYVVRKAAP